MGYYINPPNEAKEDFLRREGMRCLPEWPEGNDLALVCLMDNGPFTAAGICYDEEEMRAFNGPSDYRPKTWYLVQKNQLTNVCSEREVKSLKLKGFLQ